MLVILELFVVSLWLRIKFCDYCDDFFSEKLDIRKFQIDSRMTHTHNNMNVEEVMPGRAAAAGTTKRLCVCCGSSHCRRVAPGRDTGWPGTHPGLSRPPPTTFALMSPPPHSGPPRMSSHRSEAMHQMQLILVIF